MARSKIQQAMEHHRAARFREADLLYRELLAKNPSDVPALRGLGLLAAEVNRNDLAVQFLEQAAKLMPDSGLLLAELAEMQRRVGKLDEAEASARRAIRAEPAEAQGYFNLAVILQQQRKLEPAIASYRAALAIDNRHAAAWYNLANALRDVGQIQPAIEAYRAAITIRSDYVQAHGNLGLTLQKTGDLPAAENAFRQVLAFTPDDLVAHNSLGNLLRLRGDASAAEASYRRALQLQPHDAASHTNLGKLLHDAGNLTDAVAHYRAAIAAAPERSEAYQNLGMALEKLGRQAEAITIYREALARGVDSPVARFYMAALTGIDVPTVAPPAHVINIFDAVADRFDDHLVNILKYRGHQLAVDALLQAHNNNPRLQTVLDLGCGTGLCGELLRPHTTHLAGVDLSPRMIDQSRARNIYDELVEGDILEFLRARPNSADAVIAADVLIYFGPLEPIFAAVAASLLPAGLFAFTVEKSPHQDHLLLTSCRYAHSENYLRNLAAQNAFDVVSMEPHTLREEARHQVPGLIAVFRQKT